MKIGKYNVKKCPQCKSDNLYDSERVVWGSISFPLNWVNITCADCGFVSKSIQGLKNAIYSWNKLKR